MKYLFTQDDCKLVQPLKKLICIPLTLALFLLGTPALVSASPFSPTTHNDFSGTATRFSDHLLKVAADIQIKGVVTGDNGIPLPGVTVAIQGTNNAVTTDQSGNYSITAPANSILVFSIIGYETLTQKLGDHNRELDIQMTLSTTELNQVVVVGYGTQKRADVTGSIATVSEKTLKEVPSENLISEIQGHVAGLDVVSNSPYPGASWQIRLRGNRSMATTNTASNGLDEPLIILDGIPFSGNINDIDPDNITSVDVLEDASATAIYGSRASGGVIIITTNRGSAGKPVFSLDTYQGISSPLGYYPVYNAQGYENLKTAASAGNSVTPNTNPYGLTPLEQAGEASGVNTNWQKAFFQNGFTSDNNLSVSGGTNTTQYSIGGSFYNETGIIPTMSYQRYSLRSTLDQQVSRKLKIGIDMLNTLNYWNNQGIDPTGLLMRLTPLAPVYNKDGSIDLQPFLGATDANNDLNPETMRNTSAVYDKTRELRTFNSLYAEYEIVPDLKYRLNVGLDFTQNTGGDYYGPNTFVNVSQTQAGAQESVTNSEAYQFTIENLLTYQHTFAKKHSLTITALYSAEKDHLQSSSFSGVGMPANYLENSNLFQAATVSASPGNFADRGLVSEMARLNYGYEDKYLLTATVRRDGSSVLSSGDQYFTYPAIGLAWNIYNENFMRGASWLTNLKLRVGWGVTSNQGVAPYTTLGGLSSNAYNFGPTAAGDQTGYLVTVLANQNLHWESTSETNVGLDFGMFGNRLTGTFDVYNEFTNNILLTVELPPSNGAGSTTENVGKSEDHGVELTLNGIDVRTSKFTWTTSLNFSLDREQVVSLTNADGIDPSTGKPANIANGWFVGYPLTVIYDVKKIGIWQTSQAAEAKSYNNQLPGQIEVQDLNKDGTINASDLQIIGNFQPKWIGGMTNTFAYKRFDLSVTIFARMGQTVAVPYVTTDGGASGYDFFNNSRNNQLAVNYWTPTNPVNGWPQPDASADKFDYATTLGYVNGSFIKVQAITLGYDIPSKILERAGITSLRIYAQAENPFFLYAPFVKDGYGPDPEGNGYGNYPTSTDGAGSPVQGRAITVSNNAPSTKQFNLGVNLKF